MTTTRSSRKLRLLALAGALVVAGLLAACDPTAGPVANPATGGGGSSTASSTTRVAVTISGGHDTEAVDNGRPVVLIASILGVPPEVFREAFSGVTPAGPDRGPTGDEARANKAALLSVLGPYGITNDQLDEVSNYYRYMGVHGESWTQSAASAVAVIRDGEVIRVRITDPGSGYTSAPTVTIPGHADVDLTAAVQFTSDYDTNGSLSSITVG